MNTKAVTYPNRLKELRKVKQWQQRDVAQLLGFSSEDRVSYWENGFSIPNIPNLSKSAKIPEAQPQDIYPDLLKQYEAIK